MDITLALALGYFTAGFIAAGFSEVFSPLACCVLVILWYRKRERKYLIVLLGVILGVLVVFLAPGNAVREAALPPRMPVFVALRQALQSTGLFLIGQVANHLPALLLAFCVGYLCPLEWRIRHKALWFEVLGLVTVGTIVFTLFMPLALSGGLTDRHTTYASFIITLSIGFMGVLCAGKQPQ